MKVRDWYGVVAFTTVGNRCTMGGTPIWYMRTWWSLRDLWWVQVDFRPNGEVFWFKIEPNDNKVKLCGMEGLHNPSGLYEAMNLVAKFEGQIAAAALAIADHVHEVPAGVDVFGTQSLSEFAFSVGL